VQQLDDSYAVVLGLGQNMSALREQNKFLIARGFASGADTVATGEVILWHLQNHLIAELATGVFFVVYDYVFSPVVGRRDDGSNARGSENVARRGDVVTKISGRDSAASGNNPHACREDGEDYAHSTTKSAPSDIVVLKLVVVEVLDELAVE
jgi:hypothetical protein